MKTTRRIETFNDRYPLIGPAFWLISVQYFIVQLIVALRWSQPYSVLHNTISDLGNTICGSYGTGYVCSPLHNLMNASFIVLGCTMIAGAVLIYREFKQGRTAVAGFTFMALAGFGTILVGLFPENTNGALHEIGASLPFFIGNLGMIILGSSLTLPKWLRYYTIISGLISLVALIFFASHNYLGFGIGGMERIVAYPQTVWLIVFGLYMSRRHYQENSTS